MFRISLLLAAVVVMTSAACSSVRKDSAAASLAAAESAIDIELDLQQLDAAIADRNTDVTFPPHRLIEAKELRRAAGEQFLTGDRALARELIGEAFDLLGISR